MSLCLRQRLSPKTFSITQDLRRFTNCLQSLVIRIWAPGNRSMFPVGMMPGFASAGAWAAEVQDLARTSHVQGSDLADCMDRAGFASNVWALRGCEAQLEAAGL